MEMFNIWQFIHKKLSADSRVILMLVCESVGSSPGRVGHLMAVADDFKFIGTIGGGAMEYKEVEFCKNKLSSESDEKIFRKRLIHKNIEKKDWSGLSCSGEQTIIYIDFDKSNLLILENIIAMYKSDNNCSFYCNSEGNIKLFTHKHENKDYQYELNEDNSWSYKLPIDHREIAYVIGAGHVGLSLCRQLYLLNFKVILIDNRKDIDTDEFSEYYHKKIICSYKDVSQFVNSNENDYIVIMSFSSALDELILSQLITKPSRYIGMMASQSKYDRIKKNLTEKKIDLKYFDNLKSPIGILNNCKSPAEIALSVAAEMLSIRYGKPV